MGGARFITAGAIASILVLAIQLPATAQESGIDIVVEPASGSDTAAGGGYFLLAARPGQSLEQALALRNDSNRRLFLRLAAVDATTGPYGGVSYGLGTESPSRTGSWIALDETSVNLGPGDSEFVTFKIDIPRDAPSGENLAGISVWSPAGTAARDDGAEGQAGAEITIQARRIVAVQVNLPGVSNPNSRFQGLNPRPVPTGCISRSTSPTPASASPKARVWLRSPGKGSSNTSTLTRSCRELRSRTLFVGRTRRPRDATTRR